VSLEEFARTLTSGEEERERYREGGVRSRRLRSRTATASAADRAAFIAAFRRFRAFEKANVLHLFATFARRPAFSREFPEAMQTGPLWPGRGGRRSNERQVSRTWLWYATPASAEKIAPDVAAALGRVRPSARLLVRVPRPWRTEELPEGVEVRAGPIRAPAWRRHFTSAEMRIVTGSRTLLEALEDGGRFLYFNGVLGTGAGRRRHRPEKLVALLALARRHGWPADLTRDLADFARGRRVRAIVERAALRQGGWAAPPPPIRGSGFPAPFDDAGAVLLAVARDLSGPRASARGVVALWRRRSNLKSGRPGARGDAERRRHSGCGRSSARRRRPRAPSR
jgi:hypothetical protein